ncbi:phosphatase PAP2 family protein [Streptomyces sp. NBC_00102]|uniref:phosphatase PAP2 family protein n=1 Tax=Streptomyces sp. NBC_00102 TaxID=2975652 RepID=UPI0022515B6F|nr:phosphatase PAP2 family protein [Streptomyces sp. NBC_00102]MCX5401751.1 phosphatase PAP2 family protein [Streptomyces sp. NBC_00102]
MGATASRLLSTAHDGSGIDGTAYLDVVDTAHHAPGWLDGLISGYSTYGLALFAVLMLVGWWQTRRQDARLAVKALAAPVLTVIAFAVSSGLKDLVRESRPCQALHVTTLEACPAPGDWSFPSNHATLAAAAAVALWFVSARLGAVAVVAALAMAASRVWVGAHYPHDVVAALMVGALVTVLTGAALDRYASAVAGHLSRGRLRPLVVS